MNQIQSERKDGVVTLTLNRGKVNALNDDVVGKLMAIFAELSHEDDLQAVIRTRRVLQLWVRHPAVPALHY